jgi:hypothetical protein
MHARHAGGFFYELVKYVTRSLQSPFDDPNLAAFSQESDKESASVDFRSGRLKKNIGSLMPDGVESNEWSSPKL